MAVLDESGVINSSGIWVDQGNSPDGGGFSYGFDWPGEGGDELLESLVFDVQALRHGLHGFSSALGNEALEIVAAGGRWSLWTRETKTSATKVRRSSGMWGGCRAHNRTLRRWGPTHKSY